MLVFFRPAQHPVAKLVINPEVDEEIGEVVDENEKVEVAQNRQVGVCGYHNRREGGERNNKQHCSDLDRLHVAFRLRERPESNSNHCTHNIFQCFTCNVLLLFLLINESIYSK